MTDHPDLDALSAAVDGDDPAGAVAGHVAACGGCRARQDALRRARRAVATPVPPLPGPARERLVAAALAAAVEGDADAGQAPPRGPLPTELPPGRRPAAGPLRPPVAAPERRRWWLGGAAAAAVMAVVVGVAGLTGRGTGGGTDTALSRGPAPEVSSDDAAGGPASVVEAGSLGDVADVAALRARLSATPAAAAGTAGPAGNTASARANSGGAPGGEGLADNRLGGDGLAATAPPGAPGAAASEAPVPRQVGTRPCEEQARTARPQVGALVYVATARFAGTPAVVLGFGSTPASPPATVLVLAESGCRLLAETSVP